MSMFGYLALAFSLGLIIGVLVASLLGMLKRRQEITEAIKSAEDALAEAKPRTAEEQAQLEESLNHLIKLRNTANISSRILFLLAATGGVVGIGVVVHQFFTRPDLFWWPFEVSLLSTSAYAQEAATPRQELAWVMPWIALGILSVMAAAFIGALLTALLTKDTTENQSRIKVASDIVKTFGGFFTGLATTLLS